MSRRGLWVTLLGCASVLVLSATLLTMRLSEFYREHPPTRFVFQDLDLRSCSFGDRNIDLRDEMDSAGTRYLVVTFGDETRRLRVTIPSKQHELLVSHGLAAHRDWMRLLRFTDATGRDPEESIRALREGRSSKPDRLAIVTRSPRAGVDASTWGEVFRKDWSFEFYEFMPEGGFAFERLHYPTNKRGEPPKPGEIAEGTWQWDAALLTMPKSGTPQQRFVNTGFKAMGWTFPAACLSSTAGLFAAVMLAYRPRARGSSEPRARGTPEQDRP